MYGKLMFTTAIVAVAITGCSTTKQVTVGSSKSASSSAAMSSASSASSAESSAPAAKLDASSCVEITQANLDLATASNADAARTAGNAFEKYDLPAEVKDAVEHFVSTSGAQFDDPKYDKFNNAIEGWIKQVCPL
ncbi:hypothetical protein [Mycolicibacterium llatzerense]|uniref:Uncharacterized protein n=1 Tax=Mycolicibacterium llatzerense TaxID=280871 RepID=A0A0D1JVA7_9MYCO|nr:hypothetical protein [Mycolicibacterium llatzerense]KIU16524.1 hypothetical protein TL10_12915 [Mycolicibacterium llatzerense]